MRVGLFGGSFDPIHCGHLRPVQQAREALELEEVIYLPTARPPHKARREFAPAHARYTMVELALLGEEGLFASPFEMSLDRMTYTVDTVEHFRRRRPDAQWVLLIGGDSLAELMSWREWQRIVEMVELAVLVRPGWESDALVEGLPAELRDALAAGRLRLMPNDPLPISSTDLRRRLAAGEEISPAVVPRLVLDYVRKYELYREHRCRRPA
ncbi:MAG: nicotinate (nicotinamide) nucleotide adenylyltransferase [bacterium]|nr:nicotinate (nicotinamide) nucleotide adenylyltransferase [bacterium]